LHYLRAFDEPCKSRLRQRKSEQPEGSQPTTGQEFQEFDEITKYLVRPEPAAGFEVKEDDADRPSGARPWGR
jgi:hypothetical protein